LPFLERIMTIEFADNSCPADSAVADNDDAGIFIFEALACFGPPCFFQRASRRPSLAMDLIPLA